MHKLRPLAKVLSANANTSGFTAKTALATTRPSSNVLDLGQYSSGGVLPCAIILYPYGLGSNNNVFSLRVWGWNRYLGQELWVPHQLAELSCTLSAFAGVAGQAILNTELFCDTISIVATVGEPTTTANTTRDGTIELYSPANDQPAWAKINTYGAEILEFDFDQTTGTPTMNALYKLIG